MCSPRGPEVGPPGEHPAHTWRAGNLFLLHRPTVAFPSVASSATRDHGPKAKRLLTTTQPLQLRPPNEVSHAQRRHEVESLRTVARYVRWLCIGQLGVHLVFKEL